MDIDAILVQIEDEAKQISSLETLEEFRLKYLGRKGLLSRLTSTIPSLPISERASFGQKVNLLKNKINLLIAEKQKIFACTKKSSSLTLLDLGLPGINQERGFLHPLTKVMDEICQVFIRMGFSLVEGPEIETEYNNFTGLNIPLEHPSREAFDTFYLEPTGKQANRQAGQPASRPTGKLLLRSHTSPVQIRAMKSYRPPLAIIVPGRVYRPDAVDASHSFMFHQVEGFMVDKDVRFSDLKGVLELFAKEIFGEQIRMRFRPHFFPFTEPSSEVDISCIICKGKGCSVCGKKGWLEILGAGMIHPKVLKNVEINPKEYTGFAFGLGIERITMLKYGINDIRLFFENDLRFLKQF